MNDYIEQRALALAQYIISSGATVRNAAEVFKISKSTVHKDVTERLEKIDSAVCEQVKAILDKNKAERHIRGGFATRMKYKG
ncbi:MAG: sporulation transcriptional regulator SpoIIID [Clostridia bacterium]|nr:sporulation transcriptional regulator SpoIIID [Clostridia bacterium]